MLIIARKITLPVLVFMASLAFLTCGDMYSDFKELSGRIWVSGPDMSVNQGSTNVPYGGSFDVGSTVVATTRDVVFTIVNNSTRELDLDGTPPVSITGTDAGSFTVTADPVSPIPAGGSTTFTIRFDPFTSGTKTANISIANSGNTDPYEFVITGTATPTPEPEINILQGANIILSGESYDFGSTLEGTMVSAGFTIQNIGSADLNLSGSPRVNISGADAGSFSVTAQPGTPVTAGGNTGFTVQFNPSTGGYKSATVNIASDDGDENPYVIYVSGTALEPGMTVSQGGTTIASGGNYDFGTSTSVTFTIENTGDGTLYLEGTPLVSVSNANFTVTADPAATVGPGGSTTFTVQLTPVTTGTLSADISIANSDGDNDPYTFTVTAVPFTTVWKTDYTDFESSGDTQVELPLASGGTCNFVVAWGDGTYDTITAYNQTETTHTYASAGTYTVSMYGRIEGFGFPASGGDRIKLIDVANWGPVRLHNNGRQFYACTNLTGFSAADNPDLSNVTNMSYMFSSAALFNGNISGWNVSAATNMYYMFMSAAVFNRSLNSWDVSHVTNMGGMFYQAYAFNGNISGWDVSHVTNMAYMFARDTAFTGDISGWDVSQVTDMSGMFFYASSFNRDLTGWNVSQVTNMNGMFMYAGSFNGDISTWNTSNVTDMHMMFSNAVSFNGDISGWDVSQVEYMDYMFYYASSFNRDLPAWNVSGVTTMRLMFAHATAFNGNITTWVPSHVTNMDMMFEGATSFNRDLSGWCIGNVTTHTDFNTGATSWTLPKPNWASPPICP